MRYLFFLCSILMTAVLSARDVLPLNNNWSYRPAWDFAKHRWHQVNLPHTWNTADKESDHPYSRFMGLYRQRNLLIPNEWQGKRVFLRFKGAAVVSNVTINDHWLGEHRGAYTAFCYEITDYVHYGKKNDLLVTVSNAETTDVMPLTGDFNIFGGLYRTVDIVVTDPICISPLESGSSGVRIEQVALTDHEARLNFTVNLLNKSQQPAQVEVEVAGQTYTGSGVDSVTIPVTITDPHRWDGITDPFLYSATIRVGNDSITQSFGVREITIDPAQGLSLNGKPIKLHGVTRHQEVEGKLSALTLEDHKRDVAIIREMGANAVRLAHYPQADEFYTLCDEAGLLVWAEIPFIGPGGYDDLSYIASKKFQENGKTQLIEMIRQLGNHPSIFTWGLFNELRMTPNPVPYIKELHALAKQLDPSRPTTAASNIEASAGLSFVTDLIAWNRYNGWYGGMPKDLGAFLDATHKKFPKLAIAISEYGAGASIKQHEELVRKPNPSGNFHPEGWQTEYHRLNWIELSKRDFVWGSFIWNLFDFAASHRTEGDRDGINDKGLVTHDRKTFKDAFYFYKANWRDDVPVLYLCDKRFVKRQAEMINVLAFSNVGPAELFVNGVSQGVATPDAQRVLTWSQVKLTAGQNAVVIRAKDKPELEDSCQWQYK